MRWLLALALALPSVAACADVGLTTVPERAECAVVVYGHQDLALVRDRRTIGLLVIAPMLVLTLGAILFRSEPAAIPLGVVNEDQGLAIPMAGTRETSS